jgi:hypothetical protein
MSGLGGSIETSGTTYPNNTASYPDDLTPQKQDCGNLMSQKNEDSNTDKTN